MFQTLRRLFRPKQNPPAPRLKQPAQAGQQASTRTASAPSRGASVSSSTPDPILSNPLHPLNPASQVYYVAPAPEPARYCSEAGAGRSDSDRFDCSPSRDSGGWGDSSTSSSDSSTSSSDSTTTSTYD